MNGQNPGPAAVLASGPLTVLAPGPEDMLELGAALARVLQPGDTVLLGGELGAGKTTLTRGLALALGVEEPVTSPTFVLMHSYRTAPGWSLVHADVWRLEQLHEVIDLAIPEMLEEGAAAVVEWGERAAPALAADCLHVAIDFAEDAQAVDVPSQARDVPGQARDVPGQARDVPGQARDVPGQARDVPGQSTPIAAGLTPGLACGGSAGPGATRRVVLEARGPSWAGRMGDLAAAIAATSAAAATAVAAVAVAADRSSGSS